MPRRVRADVGTVVPAGDRAVPAPVEHGGPGRLGRNLQMGELEVRR